MIKAYSIILSLILFVSCHSHPKILSEANMSNGNSHAAILNHTQYDTTYKTIHVLVALCDNKYQGIVPVPAKIGNGQDPDNNLYWGCNDGIRSYFKRSKSWILLKHYHIDSIKMERLIFKNKKRNYYLLADAYNGKYIQQCTVDFLKSCSGQVKDTININGKIVGIYGNSALLAYIGHDGLMDFRLTEVFENIDNKKRDAIILACISKKYFYTPLTPTKANPLVWTTGLMCPEAYTLHDALESYIDNESVDEIRNSAARAYSKYQHCSEKAAKGLLVAGW